MEKSDKKATNKMRKFQNQFWQNQFCFFVIIQRRNIVIA